MKGTKEMSRFTLYPPKTRILIRIKAISLAFSEYLKQNGYLSGTKTKELLDPYFRFKLLTSAKFNEKKYRKIKIRLLDYYNSLGFRDAGIVS